MKTITDALGVFSESKPRGTQRGSYEPLTFRWAWGDQRDGSWYAVMVDDQFETRDNTQYFPTAWEAQRYAELRAQGFLDAGALMTLMEERVRHARSGVGTAETAGETI